MHCNDIQWPDYSRYRARSMFSCHPGFASSNAARTAGSGTRGLTVGEVARATYYHPERFPFGWSPLLEAAGTFDSGHGTYANASQIVLVEVDAETGAVEILEYHIVEDCGQMINPTIVEGQIHGGVAQGIGGALYEELIYDEEGQLLTTSFMDYLIPGPTELPNFAVSHLKTPSPTSPNGIKGALRK